MLNKTYIPYLFLLLYFCIPILPRNNTMDVIGLQWTLYSLLNLVFFIYNLKAGQLFKNWGITLKVFLGLLLVMATSLMYTTNLSLGLQDLSRWLTVFISVWLFSVHFSTKKINTEIIAKIITLILLLEVNNALMPLYLELLLNGFQMLDAVSIDANVFNGFTGNKNIAAASIAVKIPFALFLLSNKSKGWYIISVLTLVLGIISIMFISARASYLSLFAILLGSFCFGFINKKRTRQYYINLAISLIMGFGISYILVPNSTGNAMAKKVATISFTEKGSSGRNFLWNDAFRFGSENIVSGGGLGSWKIESAPFWNAHGSEYLVPYHAHNDFLEIFAELGVVGLVLFVSIFVIVGYTFIKRALRKQEGAAFYYFCTLSFGAYFVDSVFNFPMERVIMMLLFALLIILSLTNTATNEK